MKYLKKFNQASEYEAFKVGDGYVTPNVSYVEEINCVNYEPYVAPASPSVVCTYNVTDISQKTKILNESCLSYVTNMIVDGFEMDIDCYYQFDTVGNHVVEFVLCDPTIIGNSAFASCSGLTSITIPNSVTSIDVSAFYYCSGLTSINIPDSVTSIGNSVFRGCTGLTSITIPNSVTSIGDRVFYSCTRLTSIVIPDSVTSIGSEVFVACSGLTSVVIPDSVTSIGNSAFSGCSGLASINIPDSVTSIGSKAFEACSGLTAITSYAVTAPTIASNTFINVKYDGTLYVPAGSDYSSWMSNYYLDKYNWTIQYI